MVLSWLLVLLVLMLLLLELVLVLVVLSHNVDSGFLYQYERRDKAEGMR